MGVNRADINGNPYIGVFCRLVGDVCLLPADAPEAFSNLVENNLSVATLSASLGGTNLHGSLTAANSKGLLAPYFFSREEIERAFVNGGMGEVLEKLVIGISDDPMTSWGNNVLISEKAAYMNPDLEKGSEELVSQSLDVEVVKGKIAGIKTVGSVAVMNSSGLLVHPKATREEMDLLADLFGTDVRISTANFGSPYLGASVIANDRGALIGERSSGVEINRIENVLNLI
jgi:translation initiation factor 6